MIDDMSFQFVLVACCDLRRLATRDLLLALATPVSGAPGNLLFLEQSRIYSRGYYADDKLVHVKTWSGLGYLETFLLALFTRT
jgi:hypothetical protein